MFAGVNRWMNKLQPQTVIHIMNFPFADTKILFKYHNSGNILCSKTLITTFLFIDVIMHHKIIKIVYNE
jgi:hypothetical protein